MTTFKNVMGTIGKSIATIVILAAVAVGAVGLYSILDTSAQQTAEQVGISYVKEHKLTGDYEVIKDGPLSYRVDCRSIMDESTTTVGYELPWE